MNREPGENSSEERFARQDSGWTSAFAIAAIVIMFGIVRIVYHVLH
jgi:hypothetical protein